MSNNNNKNASVSRRNFLKIFAAGAAGTVGTIAFGPLAGLTSAQEPGTLRVAWDQISNFNPANASGDSEISFLSAVHDYLINTDAAANLVPGLASSWEASDDATAYTLQIREDVTFHDGSPLTVADVLYTFEYHAETPSLAGLLGSIESIEAGDANTVVFTLSEANGDFLNALTDNKLIILKEGATDYDDPTNHLGTGPFILEEHLPLSRSTFVANADYWGGAPTIDRLEFIYYDDTQAGITQLQGGQADAIFRLDNASFLGFSGDTNFSSISIPTSGHRTVRLRTDIEPGNDPRVIQAFKLATDNQAIWDRVQLGFGSVGQDSPIGPAFGAIFADDVTALQRDPEAAAALLAEAGYPDGIDLELNGPNSGEFPDLALSLAGQWEEAGIRVEINLTPENEYYSEDWVTVPLGMTGWGHRSSALQFLALGYETGGGFNDSAFSSEELDALIARARTTLDEAELAEIYREIQQFFVDQGPIVVPYFFAQYMVTGANVEGVDLHPFAGRTRFNTAVVS